MKPYGRAGIRTAAVLLTGILTATAFAASGQDAEPFKFFREYVGLNDEQIKNIRSGKAVAKILDSPTPDEVYVFGSVYVNSTPERYVKFASDIDALRKVPNYLAVQKFSDPPKLSDLEGFTLEEEDIKELKKCEPGHCEIQLPTEAMDTFRQSINWSAPPAELDRQVNQHLHQRVIEGLQAYRRDGNQALGVYVDKENPTDVPRQFAYMLSYAKALPKYLPDFQRYLLAYPNAKSENISDMFYWAKVKFGLKPTLRVVQVVTLRGTSANEATYAIAEKQLYSSHYFETALDLTFCVRATDDPKQVGFYLIKAMGSEQAGLTGVKGSMVRKVAVGRTASSLEKSLATIKNILEAQ